MTYTPAPARSTTKTGRVGQQLPELEALVERALAAGLHVFDDPPGVTAFASAGVTMYRADQRPPATLNLTLIRIGDDAEWRRHSVTVWHHKARSAEPSITDPSLMDAAVDEFLERYACPT